MFCEDHRIDYAGENDKTLYLVDLEEKVMLFFYEVILKMTTVVFVKPGCHGQTRQEQESEGNVWFIVNCRLRNKRGKDPSYLSYVGKRMKWRQNISGAGSGAETWVGLVLAPGS